MKPVVMFTNVWGDNHLELMDKSLVKSLLWPKNNEALKEATWFIYTKKEEFEKARRIAEKIGVKEIILKPLPDWLIGTPPQMGIVLLDHLQEIIKYCIENKAQMLMAPPDTFFSEESIPNLLKMARFGNTCVAVPHARVHPEALDLVSDIPLSGVDLAKILKLHKHKSWEASEIGNPIQNSFVGGIAWERVNEKLCLVQHRLPTIYVANFVEQDAQFFRESHDGTEPVYGAWDHLWPMKLVREERQRMPGSSDVAFMLEVTKADQNVPALVEQKPGEPDAFWRNALHNQHNRQFLFTLREE